MARPAGLEPATPGLEEQCLTKDNLSEDLRGIGSSSAARCAELNSVDSPIQHRVMKGGPVRRANTASNEESTPGRRIGSAFVFSQCGADAAPQEPPCIRPVRWQWRSVSQRCVPQG